MYASFEHTQSTNIFESLKVVVNEKGGGLGGLANIRRRFRTMAINVCLLLILLSSSLQRISVSVL